MNPVTTAAPVQRGLHMQNRPRTDGLELPLTAAERSLIEQWATEGARLGE